MLHVTISYFRDVPKSLEGTKFVIVGKTSKSKANLTKEITSLGGVVVAKVDDTVTACISTKGEWTWSNSCDHGGDLHQYER